MEETNNDVTTILHEVERSIDAPVVLVNIPEFIKKIKKEKAWDKNDRNAITVFKSDKLRIILVAMHKKAEMTTERPENIFSIQVISGKVKLDTAGKSFDVSEEGLLVLHPNITYKIVALRKSVFLMTVVE